jgi:hypothetical protein
MHEYRTAAPGPNLTLLLCSQVNRGSNHTILQQKNGNLEICPSKTQCAGVSAGQRGAFLEWQPTIYTHLHTRTHTHTHTHRTELVCLCAHARQARLAACTQTALCYGTTAAHSRTLPHTLTHTDLSLYAGVHTRGKQGLQRAPKQRCVTERQPPEWQAAAEGSTSSEDAAVPLHLTDALHFCTASHSRIISILFISFVSPYPHAIPLFLCSPIFSCTPR